MICKGHRAYLSAALISPPFAPGGQIYIWAAALDSSNLSATMGEFSLFSDNSIKPGSLFTARLALSIPQMRKIFYDSFRELAVFPVPPSRKIRVFTTRKSQIYANLTTKIAKIMSKLKFYPQPARKNRI